MIEIAAMNAFMFYNIIAAASGLKSATENEFRDRLDY